MHNRPGPCACFAKVDKIIAAYFSDVQSSCGYFTKDNMQNFDNIGTRVNPAMHVRSLRLWNNPIPAKT